MNEDVSDAITGSECLRGNSIYYLSIWRSSAGNQCCSTSESCCELIEIFPVTNISLQESKTGTTAVTTEPKVDTSSELINNKNSDRNETS